MTTIKAEDLHIGDVVFTPARRWETVTRVEKDTCQPWMRRVGTNATGTGYAWMWVANFALPHRPRVARTASPVIYLDTGSRSWPQIEAYLDMPDDRHVLVAARRNDGNGWEVIDHPAGGQLTITQVADKAQAVSAVKHAARAHAKALGIAFDTTGGAA